MEPQITRSTLTDEQLYAMRVVDNPGEVFIFPEQYITPASIESGERALLFAIFERAVDDIVESAARLNTRLYRRRHAKTLKWFRSAESHWPGAFVNLCHTLGLDVDKWRRWAMNYTAPISFAPEPELDEVIETQIEVVSLEAAEEEGIVQIAVGA